MMPVAPNDTRFGSKPKPPDSEKFSRVSSHAGIDSAAAREAVP
jgi:hypothetical protein